MAIPIDYNIQKKATEKMSKYVDLQIECQRLLNKKVEVIPVIIGATGIVEKNIKKYVGRIPGYHNVTEWMCLSIKYVDLYYFFSLYKSYGTKVILIPLKFKVYFILSSGQDVLSHPNELDGTPH